MDRLIKEMEKIGAITIKKLPNIILMCTVLYPQLEDWDFEVN